MVAPDYTMAAWLRRRVRQTPNRAALTFEGSTWSYHEFADRAARVASVLQAGGVVPGGREIGRAHV